tara:strand:+ start:211 stop:915 length:705 start_codon:yes stop_codon:yes gene_type:complete
MSEMSEKKDVMKEVAAVYGVKEEDLVSSKMKRKGDEPEAVEASGDGTERHPKAPKLSKVEEEPKKEDKSKDKIGLLLTEGRRVVGYADFTEEEIHELWQGRLPPGHEGSADFVKRELDKDGGGIFTLLSLFCGVSGENLKSFEFRCFEEWGDFVLGWGAVSELYTRNVTGEFGELCPELDAEIQEGFKLAVKKAAMGGRLRPPKDKARITIHLERDVPEPEHLGESDNDPTYDD